ncbi:MAG TPA: 6-phosphofructokinase [Rhizomicrobium sp.]|jgi:6-phosphofructokinase 1|nr:6-phosphofructokinase [Rhizomicrobium sp.]
MSRSESRKILVAQGGGPTAVINQSLAGIVLEARKRQDIGAVYGALHGVRGIVNQDLVDLGKETQDNLRKVAQTPAAALGSTRDKPDRKYCEEIFRVVQAHGIGAFFYIGGNDSADTVRIVSEFARTAGYPLRCVHVPKTIDNDLMVNDHTPGFPSAARFVAQAFMGANLDNWSLPGVYIGVVMGRNAGFLTAAAALARTNADDGPHLIYLPERPFRLEAFFSDVKRTVEQRGRCVVAISEGVADAQGVPVATSLAEREKDAHGNVELGGGALADYLAKTVKDTLGLKRVRGDTFGYLQRSFAGCVSDVDQQEAWQAGEKAVQFAFSQDRDGSVTIHRPQAGAYSAAYEFTALEELAGKTRTMPDTFITGTGNGVTDAFRAYLSPLLGSGLPQIGRLQRLAVEKIVAAD